MEPPEPGGTDEGQVEPPEGGTIITPPPGGGRDDNNIPWIPGEDGTPTIDVENLPPHLEVVPGDDGSYSIWQINPYPPVYIGTYHPVGDGLRKIFVPNPNIPLGLIQFPSCPPTPWWVWPLFGGMLLPWLIPLFRRRVLKVTFETGIDERNYFQEYDRGDKVVEPEGFEKDAWLLEGWYLNKKCSERKKWDFNKKLRRKITLYAKWVQPGGHGPPHGYDEGGFGGHPVYPQK